MIEAIVTDIEGTTSSLSFVKDVLFPYARAKIPAYLQQHADQPEVRQVLKEVDQIAGESLDLSRQTQQFIAWMDQDQKITPLKSLQGMVWRDGYRQGAFKGHVYPDAAKQLQTWKQAGLALYVYSSGSVEAQKLLFGYSEFGDLTPLFSDYFDTRIGGKREAASYRAIAGRIGLPADRILFLSDIEAELDAARAANLQTYWLVRGQSVNIDASHPQAVDFAGIHLQ
ncbi:acireductone synthase [Methylomonas sp. HYX-M1]|uniref:acireductone synthase n=1 Tax=Methylomonas sp. HYX-M1 TaxID=3139307 RepID=UPI00345BC125